MRLSNAATVGETTANLCALTSCGSVDFPVQYGSAMVGATGLEPVTFRM